MMKPGLLLFFLLGCFAGLAQRHDYNWILGGTRVGTDERVNYRLDFNHLPVTPATWNDNLVYPHGPMSCSDSSGNLLFYGGSGRLRNRLGQDLAGSDSVVTSINSGLLGSFALPYPGLHNVYCLLRSEFNGPDFSAGPYRLYATLIDMDAAGGLGAVVRANDLLLEDSILAVKACKHANGRDWWIIAPAAFAAKFYVFLLSPSGIEGPYVQEFDVNAVTFTGLYFLIEGPAVVLSPDGSAYFRLHEPDSLAYYGFDRCSGQFNYLGNTPARYFGLAEFAAGSRMLYLGDGRNLYVSDLLAWPRPPDTLMLNGPQYFSPKIDTLAVRDMTLAPDGKIYCTTGYLATRLHILHRPDFPGLAADFSSRELDLKDVAVSRLPQFPNYRLGSLANSPCDTLERRPGGSNTFFIAPRNTISPAPRFPVGHSAPRLILHPAPKAKLSGRHE